MLEFVEERYVWVPGPRELRRVEALSDLLVDVSPLYGDVSRQRLAEGWHLIVSTRLVENAQDLLVDVWARAKPS